jgi:hypothetical protein
LVTLAPSRPANRGNAQQKPPIVRLITSKYAPWCVALAGVLITCVCALNFGRTHGVYFSRVTVVFLLPHSSKNPNALQAGNDGLVTLAGAVGKRVSDPETSVKVVSDSVTLPGEGISHGYAVRLPNNGGQWAINYDQPVLDVQAVGTSLQEVSGTVNGVLARIRSELSSMQRAEHVNKYNLVSMRPSPQTPPLYFISGSRIRALGATLLLGTGITIAATIGFGRAVRRLRVSRSI